MSYPRIVFPGPGQVLVEPLDEVLEPGPGQLRVRALTSLVSTGTESFALAGQFDPGTFWADWVRYPFEPGYSLCARVEAVGAGVEGADDRDPVPVDAHVRVAGRRAGAVDHRTALDQNRTHCLFLSLCPTRSPGLVQTPGDYAHAAARGPNWTGSIGSHKDTIWIAR